MGETHKICSGIFMSRSALDPTICRYTAQPAGRFTFRKLKLQYSQARAWSGQTPPHSGAGLRLKPLDMNEK